MKMTRRGMIGAAAAVVLSGSAALAQGTDVSGSYEAEGRNPDGSAYTGTVQIAQQDNSVAFSWQVAGQAFAGQGVVDGRVVVVDWGESTPVVYVIMPDGELHGTWSDGQALERLLPVQ